MSTLDNDHAWVHERMAAALLGGLSAEEHARFDAHVHGCAECFDAFSEARAADKQMERALDALQPAPGGGGFEERLVKAFQEKTMRTGFHPAAKRAGFAIAAAVALAATGVFAQQMLDDSLVPNPVSAKLGADSPRFVEFFQALVPHARLIESVSGGNGWTTTAPLESRVVEANALLAAKSSDVALANQAIVPSGSPRRLSEHAALGVARGGDAPDVYFVPATDSPVNGSMAKASGGRLEDREKLKQTVDEVRKTQAGKDQTGRPGVYYGDMLYAQNVPDASGKPGEQRPQGQVAATVMPGPAATQPSTGTGATVEAAERKVIRNGTVEFEVRSFDDASATITSVVGEEGGYVASTSSDKLANGKVRGVIAVRVPPEHLDRMLLKLRALGELKSQQIGASDVTKEYTDLESELRALRAMESRLIDIIKTGNGQVKDLVVAEKQLGEYRIRIEKIEGQIRYYNNLVGMATLTITAYEKDIQTPTAAKEQENVSLNVAVEDVEKRYAEARKIVEEAGGRVVESELKKHDAGQYAASIVADVPPAKGEFVAVQLKQLGTVAVFNRDRKQTTAGGEGAPTVKVEEQPTRFTIALYNLANIAPRETAVLTIAVPEVEGAYKAVLGAVREVPDDGKLRDFQPTPIGRVVTSSLSGQQPEQMTADVLADVAAEQADEVLKKVRGLGEVMASTVTENPDTANVTSAKRGVQVRLVALASVGARENRALGLVAEDVPQAYGAVLGAIQGLEAGGKAHVLSSQLNQSDPRTVTGALTFDVQRDAVPAVEKALADAGVDTLSRNISRSTDTANTLDSKVRYQIGSLTAAGALAAVRTTTMGVEVENVEQALAKIRSNAEAGHGKNVQSTVSKDGSGGVVGHLIVDVPVGEVQAVLAGIRAAGEEKGNQVVENPEVPRTRFAMERVDVTLSSRGSLVRADKGLAATLRSALGSAAAALLWSLYLIVTGALFVGPWVVIGWVGWKVTRRRVV